LYLPALYSPAFLAASTFRLYCAASAAEADSTAAPITKDATFFAMDGDVLDIGKDGGQRLRVFADGGAIGLFNVAGAGAGRDGLRMLDGAVAFDIAASEVARLDASGLKLNSGQIAAPDGTSAAPIICNSVRSPAGTNWPMAMRTAVEPTSKPPIISLFAPRRNIFQSKISNPNKVRNKN